LVSKADTKLSVAKKKVGKKKIYEAFMIYLPSILVTDSAFPFKPKDRLVVKIQGEKLLIEKNKRYTSR
jgi:hypothetical protein